MFIGIQYVKLVADKGNTCILSILLPDFTLFMGNTNSPVSIHTALKEIRVAFDDKADDIVLNVNINIYIYKN